MAATHKLYQDLLPCGTSPACQRDLLHLLGHSKAIKLAQIFGGLSFPSQLLKLFPFDVHDVGIVEGSAKLLHCHKPLPPGTG